MPPVDWQAAVDLDRALVNCHIDMLRDWYRDPWGWPELDWVVGNRPEIVFRRLNGAGTHRVSKLDVAKENFAVRPAVILDPIDRLAYQAIVDRLSLDLIGDLSPVAFGWRLPPNDPQAGHYSKNRLQHENFRAALTDLAHSESAVLITDVSSFFASIPVDRLIDRLHQVVGQDGVVDRLADMLVAWDAVDGRSGIPQRSLASCVLANFYLSGLDTVLTEYAPPPGTFETLWGDRQAAARWMDDMWLFGDDAATLRKAQVEIQQRLADIGLLMNLGKTRVIEGSDLIQEAVRVVQHSAVEEDLGNARTFVPLDELISDLCAVPETSNRTSIRFATTKMRMHSHYDRLSDVQAVAHRMPHASDGLGRLFRDSDAWREMGAWYVNYSRSDWACIDWSLAEFGRMFPSSTTPPNIVSEFMMAQVLNPASMALLPLAVERGAAWDPATCRSAIRDRRGSASHPQERRALALAALAVGEDAQVIRQMLGEFEENSVTLAMLEDRGWTSLPVKPDYAGW